VQWVDYKDVDLLRSHMSDRGKIRARHVTGTCARHQGEINVAIKTARDLVLLPYGNADAAHDVTNTESTGGTH
jgi:small subunit ribosomal protein S18